VPSASQEIEELSILEHLIEFEGERLLLLLLLLLFSLVHLHDRVGWDGAAAAAEDDTILYSLSRDKLVPVPVPVPFDLLLR